MTRRRERTIALNPIGRTREQDIKPVDMGFAVCCGEAMDGMPHCRKELLLVRARTSWFAISIVILLGAARPASAQAWIQWSAAASGNNHYYTLTPVATNWVDAEKLAVSMGGTLATITSSNEQEFVNSTFLTGRFEHLPLWIGLYAPPAKGKFSGKLGPLELQVGLHQTLTFKWVTGEQVSYTNWKPGEPSNTPPGENYVAINWEYSDIPPRGDKGDWNDTPLNGTTRYGGKTSGPYYGLVERETDPNRPVRMTFANRAMYISVPCVVIAVFLMALLGRRRRLNVGMILRSGRSGGE